MPVQSVETITTVNLIVAITPCDQTRTGTTLKVIITGAAPHTVPTFQVHIKQCVFSDIQNSELCQDSPIKADKLCAPFDRHHFWEYVARIEISVAENTGRPVNPRHRPVPSGPTFSQEPQLLIGCQIDRRNTSRNKRNHFAGVNYRVRICILPNSKLLKLEIILIKNTIMIAVEEPQSLKIRLCTFDITNE